MSCGHVIMGRLNGHSIHADLKKRIDIVVVVVVVVVLLLFGYKG